MSTTSATETHYDSYGNVTYSAQYDFGASTPTVATTTVYGTWNGASCVGIGANITSKACDVSTVLSTAQGSFTVAHSRFSYESHGNLTTTSIWNGSAWIGQTNVNTYNGNCTVLTSYDAANHETTYGYLSTSYLGCGSCTQYPFATSISKGGLTTYSTWYGIGGVKSTDKDASGNTTTYCYNTGANCSGGTADPFWRVLSVTDPLGNEVTKTYPTGSSPDTLSSNFSFNSGNSIQNTTTTTDVYGRPTNVQTKQGPSSSTYDTVSTAYVWGGTNNDKFVVTTNIPCSANLNGSCGGTNQMFTDMLGRTTWSSTPATGEYVSTVYTQNDALYTLAPAPTNEDTKEVQKEYDGLGRLTSSCKVSSSSPLVSGSVLCNQKTNTSFYGVLTTTSYSAATGSQTVTSTRGPNGSSESRSKTIDAMGRVTQKVTPEGGTWNYYYDSYSSCPTLYKGANGLLTAVKDPNGNLICYAYDSLNRVTGVNANGTTCRHFYYDNSTGYSGAFPTGVTAPTNPYGRMVEAATDSCASGTLITDEWFSYDKDGHVLDQWELTPHSTQYYHSKATFNGNGTIATETLASPSFYTVTYGLDGEGRLNMLSSGSTQIVSGVTYNAASQPTIIDIGASTDQDDYIYDPNTGRMTNWTFQVGTALTSETGALNWNPNGTLNNLVITDGFNAGGTQTCYFNPSSGTGMGYDDLGRLLNVSCGTNGSIWNQAFSYDQYDNLTKSSSGPGVSWNPGYDTHNRYLLGGTSYDLNGNVTSDSINTYYWNEFSRPKSINSTCGSGVECITYDALGRMVENSSNGSTYTEIWYTQAGKVYMNGTTLTGVYWPTPGGGSLYEQGNGTTYSYFHKDWLGSARITSNVTAQTVTADVAFAPYGEVYDKFNSPGTKQIMFTGDTQDEILGIFNTPNRELAAYNQGRWLSPDPAGAGWNQYAYGTNPNSATDPSGLCEEMANNVGGARANGTVVCPNNGNSYGMNNFVDTNAADINTIDSEMAVNGPPAQGTVGADGWSSSIDPNDPVQNELRLEQMEDVVYQIINFNRISAAEVDQIIAAYNAGLVTPAELQSALQTYTNPPGDGSGMIPASESIAMQQAALNNIQNWVEAQMKGEILSDVAGIVATSSPALLNQFSGMLTQGQMNNQPGATAQIAEDAVSAAYNKTVGWIFGQAAWVVQGVINALTPTPPSQMLMQQTQSTINKALRNP